MDIEERLNQLENNIEQLGAKVDNNYNDITANINRLHSHEKKINNNEQKIETNASAIDILHTSEENGRRIYKILIVVLIMWVITLCGTIAGFLYYIHTTGYEEVTETVESNDGGNACLGENCNNGEINYGKGN